MLRTKPFWVGLILALCCLLLIVILASPHGQTAVASVQAPPTKAAPLPGGPGMPAIHPSLPAVSMPRFTVADVQAYLKTHRFVGGPSIKGTTVGIISIQFITSEQASVLMHGEETGLSPTATVCYVKLHGPFTLAAPGATGARQLPTVPYGVEIFDARTGNLLMWWAPSA
ncbi:MAG: hypothetical protein WCD86_24935 [Ktedonobacteraceae bacterium]